MELPIGDVRAVEEPIPTVPAPEPGRPTASDWSRVQGPGPAPVSPFGPGELIGRSFRIWARHAALFAAVGGVCSVPMAAVMYRFYERMPLLATADPSRVQDVAAELPRWMGSLVLGWLVSLVAWCLGMSAVCQGAAQALRGERARPAAMLAAAIHRTPYVLALVLLVTLAALVSACTVVIPILLLVGWCAAIPAIVVERVGPFHALRRSWDLSRKYRWRLLAGFAVITLALMAAGGVLQGATTAVLRAAAGPQSLEPGSGMALAMAIYQVFAGMLGTITTVAVAVAHHGLRAAKEGGEPAALGRVFE